MQKKLLFIIVAVLTYLPVKAQNFIFVDADTLVSGNDSDDELLANLTVVNISGFDLNIEVERTINNLATGHESYFCWDNCYPPSTSQSNSYVSIPYGDSSTAFLGYLMPNGASGISKVTYLFRNVDDPKDTSSITITYNVSQTSSVKHSILFSTYISSAFPNPVNHIVSFKVLTSEINMEELFIKVYDITGRQVLFNYSKQEDIVSINTTQLSKGLFFVNFYNEGEEVLLSRYFNKF